MLLTFNVYDLVVLDWLVFVCWRPAAIVLPGTEGRPDYGDLRFHVDALVKGIALCLLAGGGAVRRALRIPPVAALRSRARLQPSPQPVARRDRVQR